MRRANIMDKNHVIQILSKSFSDKKSVNYVVKQDEKREERIKSLMEYSFDVCHAFGEVWKSSLTVTNTKSEGEKFRAICLVIYIASRNFY